MECSFGRESNVCCGKNKDKREKTAFGIYSARIVLVLYGFIIEISYCSGLYRAHLVKISIQPGRYPDLYPSSISSWGGYNNRATDMIHR